MSDINEKKYRYPGARSFTTDQAHLFMGREADIAKLYNLIQARQIVVVYAKSGMGKSSLINAGILPECQKAERPPVCFSIRLFNKEQTGTIEVLTPIQTLVATLRQQATEEPWLVPFRAEKSLWYWLKQWQWQNPKVPMMLFFDQFEELFTYTEEEVAEFGNELRSIIYQNTPDLLEDLDSTKFNDEQLNFLYQKIDFRLVFIIRSDRMALLNKLTKYIPHIQQHFYELDAISEPNAREAILKPAQLQGEAFVSPIFSYENAVVDAIINRVKNSHDGKIETATLQIILHFIEEHKVFALDGKPMNLAHLGNIKDIFKDFYQTSLNKLNNEEKAIASKTIEERFIQNNQRIPFAGEYLKLEDKWTDNLLKQLEESTLLRKERDTAGRFIYEIGHDTLIEPIVEFAEERKINAKKIAEEKNKQAEEAKRQQAIQALENKNLQQALEARKQLLNYAKIAGVILIGLLVFAFYLWLKAEDEKENADKERVKADSTLNQLIFLKAKTLKENGDNIKGNGYPCIAKDFYDAACKELGKIEKLDTSDTTFIKQLDSLNNELNKKLP